MLHFLRSPLLATAIFLSSAFSFPTQAQSPSEVAFWQAVSQKPSADKLDLYLDTYPNGHYAALAKVMIAELNGKQDRNAKPSPSSAKPRKAAQPDNSVRALEEQCDQLAADPHDTQYKGKGASAAALKKHIQQAQQVCAKAVRKSDNPRMEYQLARAYLVAGDKKRGLPTLQQARSEGYLIAAYMYARLVGAGVTKEKGGHQRALVLHLENAERGSPNSAFDAGYMLSMGGFNDGKEHGRAFKLLWQAQRAGLARANGPLGWLYEKGTNLERSNENRVKALYHYREAVKDGALLPDLFRRRLADLLLVRFDNWKQEIAHNINDFSKTFLEATEFKLGIKQKTIKDMDEVVSQLLKVMQLAYREHAYSGFYDPSGELTERKAVFLAGKSQNLLRAAMAERAKARSRTFDARDKKKLDDVLSKWFKLAERALWDARDLRWASDGFAGKSDDKTYDVKNCMKLNRTIKNNKLSVHVDNQCRYAIKVITVYGSKIGDRYRVDGKITDKIGSGRPYRKNVKMRTDRGVKGYQVEFEACPFYADGFQRVSDFDYKCDYRQSADQHLITLLKKLKGRLERSAQELL